MTRDRIDDGVDTALRPHLIRESAFADGLNLRFQKERRVQVPRKKLQLEFLEDEPEPTADASLLGSVCAFPEPAFGPSKIITLIEALKERSSFINSGIPLPPFDDPEYILNQPILFHPDAVVEKGLWADYLTAILTHLVLLYSNPNVKYKWIDTTVHVNSDLTDVSISGIQLPEFLAFDPVEETCAGLIASHNLAVEKIQALNTIYGALQMVEIVGRNAFIFLQGEQSYAGNVTSAQAGARIKDAFPKLFPGQLQYMTVGTRRDPFPDIAPPPRYEYPDWTNQGIGVVSYQFTQVYTDEVPNFPQGEYILQHKSGILRADLTGFPLETVIKVYLAVDVSPPLVYDAVINPSEKVFDDSPPVSGAFGYFHPWTAPELEMPCTNTLLACEVGSHIRQVEIIPIEPTVRDPIVGVHFWGWQLVQPTMVIFPQYKTELFTI